MMIFILNKENFKIPFCELKNKHSYHLYPLLINFKKIKKNKKEFIYYVFKKNRDYTPIINLFIFIIITTIFSYKVGDFPVSEEFFKNEISLPIYPGLKK